MAKTGRRKLTEADRKKHAKHHTSPRKHKGKRTIGEVAKETSPAHAAKMLAGAKKLQAGVDKGVDYWKRVVEMKKKGKK